MSANDSEKYQGPGRIASAMGDSYLYGLGGLATGGAVTAVAANTILKEDGKMVGQATHFLQEFASTEATHAHGKAALVTYAAIAGAGVVGTVGQIYGAVHGWGKASNGKKQFEALKAERDQAVGALNGVSKVLGSGPRGSYTGALTAEAANPTEPSRG